MNGWKIATVALILIVGSVGGIWFLQTYYPGLVPPIIPPIIPPTPPPLPPAIKITFKAYTTTGTVCGDDFTITMVNAQETVSNITVPFTGQCKLSPRLGFLYSVTVQWGWGGTSKTDAIQVPANAKTSDYIKTVVDVGTKTIVSTTYIVG